MTSDGKTPLEAIKPKFRDESRSSIGGGLVATSGQRPTDQAVELYHSRLLSEQENAAGKTPDSPGSGVLIWIDRIR